MSGLPRPVTYEDSQSEQYVANQMSDVQLPNKLSLVLYSIHCVDIVDVY